MGDAQQPSGPMRNLIVSSTPQGGHEGHEQSVAPEQQIPVTFSISPDPYVTSHPVAGDLGMAVQLVQHPQGYHFNQPQYVQGPPFLPQRSHSTPHYQPTQTVRNAANVPRALPLHPQIQQVVHIPPNSRGFQAGHPPPGIAYQLSHQVHQYQGGSVSPNGQYFVPGHQHTLVGSYGQQYTQVFTQHRDPQAQAQSGSYAVSYSSYPPHYPPSAGPTQEQFPPWCAVEINPHYLVPPQYVAHQIPAQQLPRPHQGQAPPGPYVRRHSFPPRQLPPKRQVSGSETTGATQFVGYPGVPRWDGRAANATAAGPGIGAGGGGGGDAATGGYSELSVRGPGQRYRPSTLPPPQLELSQPNSSAETSGVLASAKTPGTLYSPLPSSSSLPHPALPRGPPRKPKQSGHALWVGNLPTGARVVDLKEYFSKDAKNDIESVFLISRSNCAFVNYRTEEACSAAMIRFHDSRFQNTKLVCRLRRNSAPSAAAGVVAPILSLGPSAHPARDSGDEGTGVGEAEEDKAGGAKSPPAGPKVTARNVGKDRIFIVKSLTVEDLDMSVRTGIWATQGHNESTLNQAFEVTPRPNPDFFNPHLANHNLILDNRQRLSYILSKQVW